MNFFAYTRNKTLDSDKCSNFSWLSWPCVLSPMSFISLFDCFFNSLSILIFSPYGLLTTLSLWKFMCVLVCVRKHVLRTTGGKEKIWPKGQGWAIWMRDDPLGSRVWTLGLQLITLLGEVMELFRGRGRQDKFVIGTGGMKWINRGELWGLGASPTSCSVFHLVLLPHCWLLYFEMIRYKAFFGHDVFSKHQKVK